MDFVLWVLNDLRKAKRIALFRLAQGAGADPPTHPAIVWCKLINKYKWLMAVKILKVDFSLNCFWLLKKHLTSKPNIKQLAKLLSWNMRETWGSLSRLLIQLFSNIPTTWQIIYTTNDSCQKAKNTTGNSTMVMEILKPRWTEPSDQRQILSILPSFNDETCKPGVGLLIHARGQFRLSVRPPSKAIKCFAKADAF